MIFKLIESKHIYANPLYKISILLMCIIRIAVQNVLLFSSTLLLLNTHTSAYHIVSYEDMQLEIARLIHWAHQKLLYFACLRVSRGGYHCTTSWEYFNIFWAGSTGRFFFGRPRSLFVLFLVEVVRDYTEPRMKLELKCYLAFSIQLLPIFMFYFLFCFS